MEQYTKSIKDKNGIWQVFPTTQKPCNVRFDWENVKTLIVFDENIQREALEIEFQNTSPHIEHDLNHEDEQFWMLT